MIPKPLCEQLGFTPETEPGLLKRRIACCSSECKRLSMTKVDGLLVHQGVPDAAANWDRILDGVREERIESNSPTSRYYGADA